MSQGKIIKVSGPLVVASGMQEANIQDICRVGNLGLIGEIIEMRRDEASIQVYAETSGLGPGEPVLEALRLDAVESALIAVLDVDECRGIRLHVFVHEVAGLARVAHAVLAGGGLREGPRRPLA